MWLGWRGQPWALQDEWCVWLCPCSRGLMGQEELILGSGAGRRNAVPICKGPLAPHCKSEEHGWQPGVSQVWLSGTSRNGFESFPLCKVLVKLAWQMRREVGSLPSAPCTHSMLLDILAMLWWWFMGGWQRDQSNCQPWRWQLCRTVTLRVGGWRS